ncbi:MAG: oxidoreductase [Gammaproteobacteria bacterium CG11_big_fil_rev_8_21_14_0_20_46_22]|nr:MAG: oxidoreductase [Gammaproteobacteria bacterium CG12_big_fil_rev_8_21_14_0_65_46_12]PIR12109.1 MAG: oxidoreductase [Gammaproteobacteria bacterium CG11_big_fil_rev_8_21_14_0_20_46_22]
MIKKPSVAVIGCGYWGKNLVRNFYELGALKAICDVSSANLHAMSAQYSGLIEYSDVQTLLADETIDAVVIASPAVLHFNIAKQALLAGKDVFVEKPLALEVAEGEVLVELAKSQGRILMVGHLLHYHPAVTALKELIGRGELGKLQYIYSNRLNFGKIRREENSLWSFAPHDISVVLGLIGGEPKSVSAKGHGYLHQQIADVTMSQMTFDSGINAHIFVSWLHPFKEQKLIIVGSQKMAVFDDTLPWSEKLALYSHTVQWPSGIPEAVKAEVEYQPLEVCEPLKSECQHFLDCVLKRDRPVTDGEEGLQGLRVLAALQRSMECEGKSVELKPLAKQTYYAHETAIIDDHVSIGERTKLWHFTHVLPHTKIGQACSFGQNCVIGPKVSIGDGVKVQNNVSIYEGVEIEDDVFLGPSMVFTNVTNPRSFIIRKDEFKKTLLKKGCSVGANATIVCGVTLGEYAFVGAGAVVTKDVLPHALMVGMPARQVGWVSRAGNNLAFNDEGVAFDHKEGASYALKNGCVVHILDSVEA